MLRRGVLLCGVILGVTGIAVILTMPMHPLALLAACCGWLILCYSELARLHRGYSRCCRLRFGASGEIWLLGTDREWRPARLLSGSILLRRVGWIMLQSAGGGRFAEPIRGHCRKDPQWRRLQVIWRHIGAGL
jgi:hypothetical protein